MYDRSHITKAISAINEHGALLVFPIKGKNVPSLWNIFFPKHQMVWDWSSDGSNRIPMLWHMREELSRSDKVVYLKWYQGRATFFSRTLFPLLLSNFSQRTSDFLKYNHDTSLAYDILLDDSPIATKELKRRVKNSSANEINNFDRILKPLWESFLIAGYGEEEEGGYPSLAIGATKNLHEKLWDESLKISQSSREDKIFKIVSPDSPFLTQYRRVCRRIS